ncbi:MAG: flagellar biosynthetic protein FliR [Thermodesulfovibrionales bacterium]|nr:flagellar biosynthetic protein FliR [Thermodesulfovibrionales bacterium]
MDIYNLIVTYSDNFIPVFIRVSIMLAFIPFIGARMTPVVVRIGIALALTLLLLPVVKVNTENLLLSVFEAFFVGLAMGLSIRIIISAIEMAAQWINLQLGLGMATIFNPLVGEALGPLTFFYTLLGMVVFFMLDMHHYFIEGITRSFELTHIRYSSIFQGIIEYSKVMFPLAFKITAPVLLVQMIINIAMGFISKVMPQANIFFVALPLNIFSGIFFIILSIPIMLAVVARYFINIKDALQVITR